MEYVQCSFDPPRLLSLSGCHFQALTFLHLCVSSGPWGREQESVPFPSSCHPAEHRCFSTAACLFARGWAGALVWIHMKYTKIYELQENNKNAPESDIYEALSNITSTPSIHSYMEIPWL